MVQELADVKGLLGENIQLTRQIVRKLIPGPIVCRPFADVRGRGYNLLATGSYAGLLAGELMVKDGGGEGGI